MTTTPTPDDTEALFHTSAQARLGLDYVDAILADVFQGKRDHLREHMIGVVAKVSRRHPWPYFEECVDAKAAEKVTAAQAEGDALRSRVQALAACWEREADGLGRSLSELMLRDAAAQVRAALASEVQS